MVDWKQKLSSRKFWFAVAGFITSVLVLFGTDAGTIENVTAMITAFGSVAAYILAEGYVDGQRDDTTE